MNKKIKTDDSVSTIVKIQKLIESLQKNIQPQLKIIII